MLLSADHTPESTFQLSYRPPHFSQSLALFFPSSAGNPIIKCSPSLHSRQESNISSQLGKLPTSALYLQPLNLVPAVQAQALSSTSTMTLAAALAAIPLGTLLCLTLEQRCRAGPHSAQHSAFMVSFGLLPTHSHHRSSTPSLAGPLYEEGNP